MEDHGFKMMCLSTKLTKCRVVMVSANCQLDKVLNLLRDGVNGYGGIF